MSHGRKFLRGLFYGFVFTAYLWLIVMFVVHLCSCSGPSVWNRLEGSRETMPMLVGAGAWSSLEGSAGAGAAQGHIRYVFGATCCNPVGGVNPYVHLPARPPRVGEELVVVFVSRHGWPAPPDVPMWLIVSQTAIQEPLERFGLGSCMLLVKPDTVVAVPAGQHGVLTRRSGEGWVEFRWVPPPWSAGARFFAQLLVSSPDDRGGYLLSPAVDILIGSAPN